MTLFWCLAAVYFLTACIHTFDRELLVAKTQGDNLGKLPDWVNVFTWIMWASQIAMLYLNWRLALPAFVLAFFFAGHPFPILGLLGNFFCAPLNWSKKTLNQTLDQSEISN
jgi:hypothetical protein